MRHLYSRSSNQKTHNVTTRETVLRRRKRRREFETLERRLLLAAEISEIMADNETTLRDEDGDYSDWIELRNTSGATVNLGGMYLTNDTNDLTMWELPAGLTLDDAEHLLIFASSKDRIAGPEFHTSFDLNEAGGDIALVDTNGTTIVSQFANYPALATDEAFGLVRSTATTDLVGDGSAVNVLIPTDNSLATSWTGGNEPFNDASWTTGVSPIGYDVQSSAGFSVDEIRSTVTVGSLAVADSLIAGQNVSQTFSAVTDTINMVGSGAAGNFGNDDPFPGQVIGQDLNNFIIHATATVFVTSDQAGDWTFGVNSDDGSRLRIDGTTVISDDSNHGPANFFGTINLAPGPHSLDFVFFENGGGAEVELFSAPGSLSGFSNEFKLVGDSVNGGLAVGGYETISQLNIETEMHNVNSTAYTRYDFDIDDVAGVSNFSLTINHDEDLSPISTALKLELPTIPIPRCSIRQRQRRLATNQRRST
jgi:hypothetical protein